MDSCELVALADTGQRDGRTNVYRGHLMDSCELVALADTGQRDGRTNVY